MKGIRLFCFQCPTGRDSQWLVMGALPAHHTYVASGQMSLQTQHPSVWKVTRKTMAGLMVRSPLGSVKECPWGLLPSASEHKACVPVALLCGAGDRAMACMRETDRNQERD